MNSAPVAQRYQTGNYQNSRYTRRLRQFGIRYIDYTTSIGAVSEAVQQELNGPGKLLGYRALNQKLRTEHDIKVPRHLVHTVLADLDPAGLDARRLQNKGKKPKIPFSSSGPLWVVSLDGHDKLCGYQNSTFPVCIYGCLDTFSEKDLVPLCLLFKLRPTHDWKKVSRISV